MSPADAEAFVQKLRETKNPRHVATNVWRESAIQSLSRQHDTSIAPVELHLLRDIVDIDQFEGIFAVDEIGIWFYDGDGHIDDEVWRQRVVQWRDIDQIIIHQIS